MIIVLTSVLAIVVIAFVLLVRPQDLPDAEPTSPFIHLDERKASIYENLRDLQFEYRVGKLSDHDYQHAKTELQKSLATVMAEVDQLKAQLSGHGAPAAAPAVKVAASAPVAHSNGHHVETKSEGMGLECPACGAKFEKELKFCGECGKPMKVPVL